MQSNQSGSSDHTDDDNELDSSAAVPILARTWESNPRVAGVRRPSVLPEPQSYHEAIDPQAIFELDERQNDGSTETIFVVPYSCKRCRHSLKQACSRARPVCVRCRNAGLTDCEVVEQGYQRLPGPKYGKPSGTQNPKSTSGTGDMSIASSSTQELASGRLRPRHIDSRAAPSSQGPPPDSISAASKRSLSPESDSVPPQKKALQKRKARGSTVAPPREKNIECPEASAAVPSALGSSVVGSTGERSAVRWTFVNIYENPSKGLERAHSIPSYTLVPRVWTNSLGGLLTVFPELAKSEFGFSWFQSETPILLLDSNYARGNWINFTTLNIDLLWDFSCHDSELEPLSQSNTIQPHSYQPVMHSSGNILGCGANTMDLRSSHIPPGIASFPTYVAVSTPLQTFGTQMLPLGGMQQDLRAPYQGPHISPVGRSNPIHGAIQNNSGLANQSVSFFPPSHSPVSHPYPPLNGPFIHYTAPHLPFQPRIPLDKPPEVETLMNSHFHTIPLLLWMPRSSELVPCDLPPEYAYSCMGFFFISDLRHGVVCCGPGSSVGHVQGRVCWRVTLQWAPGGEDALFDCNSASSNMMASDSAPVDTTRDLSRPWWFDPTDTLPQTDNTTPYHPRDLRLQFFSFIPLDLLAEFHPSESFPRGWFCKTCGMINMQVFFRHQICQSTKCSSIPDNCIPPGKVDALSSLRDPYQSSTIIRPIDKAPSVVVSDCITWDDGMQSWIYSVKDGVVLRHVFTGNQKHLQEDATTLLERIQREVLLRKEDPPSSFFTHSTKLSYPSDGSETMVPGGTPECIHIAYYVLCDFVHRYGEMEKPRFGEVRLRAWVNPGSKKGNVLCASRSPVAICCLGAEVVLKFTPKAGYREVSVPDKDKGHPADKDRAGSPPSAGPSCHLEQDNGNQTPFPGANPRPTAAENADKSTAVMDTAHECCGPEPGPEVKVTLQEAVEQRVRKKNKVSKDNAPEISMTLVHGDCVILCGDDFEHQIIRTGTTILVIGFPEET